MITDTQYIDVCLVNGKIKTFLLSKKEEPNIFETLLEEDGDTSKTILETYNNAASG